MGRLASCQSAAHHARSEAEMRRVALALLAAITLSACGNQLIVKVDPDTGICYEHDRQWVIWQITNDIYPVDSTHCQP